MSKAPISHAPISSAPISHALDLMGAILGPDRDEVLARRLLAEAFSREADPLHYAAAEMGMSLEAAMRRAAEWAGLAFFETIPERTGPLRAPRLDALAEIRVLRLETVGRAVTYAAPDFFGVLRLRQAARAEPALRRRLCLVPDAAMRHYLARAASAALLDHARQNLARRWPRAVAQLDLGYGLRIGFVVTLVLLVSGLLLVPFYGPAWMMPIWAMVMLMPSAVRLLALVMPRTGLAATPPPDPAAELPVYSVLVPLRDEAGMVDQLCGALNRLDYPAYRLDIIFVVEERSGATVAALRQHLANPRFSLIEIPHAQPLTKPKALDFALPFCRGEFVVVYDAEDRPEPDQLRRVLGHFRLAPHLHCIQARLVIGNGGRGFLPALFAGEYAGLFSVFLPALARWGVVMPLGGTSNHFRLASLRAIGGWDAYNVTEDADLGVRLARL